MTVDANQAGSGGSGGSTGGSGGVDGLGGGLYVQSATSDDDMVLRNTIVADVLARSQLRGQQPLGDH